MRCKQGDDARLLRVTSACSVVIIFTLVPYREHGDGTRVVNLEQRHIPRSAEGNDDLADSRIVGKMRFPTREWGMCQQLEGALNRLQCALGGIEI